LAHAANEEVAKPRFESRPGMWYELWEHGIQMESNPGDFPGFKRLRAAANFSSLKGSEQSRISHIPYPSIVGAHAVTWVQNAVPSPLSSPKKALTPQIEI